MSHYKVNYEKNPMTGMENKINGEQKVLHFFYEIFSQYQGVISVELNYLKLISNLIQLFLVSYDYPLISLSHLSIGVVRRK